MATPICKWGKTPLPLQSILGLDGHKYIKNISTSIFQNLIKLLNVDKVELDCEIDGF